MPRIGNKRQWTYSVLLRLCPKAIRVQFVLRKALNSALVVIRFVELVFGFLCSWITYSFPIWIVNTNLTITLSCHADIRVVPVSLLSRLLILDQRVPYASFHVSRLLLKTSLVTSLQHVPQALIPRALSCRNSLGLLKRLSLNKLNSWSL